jgi:hypothetical protein
MCIFCIIHTFHLFRNFYWKSKQELLFVYAIYHRRPRRDSYTVLIRSRLSMDDLFSKEHPCLQGANIPMSLFKIFNLNSWRLFFCIGISYK